MFGDDSRDVLVDSDELERIDIEFTMRTLDRLERQANHAMFEGAADARVAEAIRRGALVAWARRRLGVSRGAVVAYGGGLRRLDF